MPELPCRFMKIYLVMLEERGIETLDQMNHFGAHNAEAIRKMPSYHVIVLAKNDIGRVNLYTLICHI